MKNRNTQQKEILQREILKMKSFFTAEELFEIVKRKEIKIGVATIYRFLKDYTENRKIHSFLCGRKAIYSISEKNHCHFICEKCSKIEHIKIDSIDFLKKGIDGKICHFQIDLNGICSKCIAEQDI